MEIKTATEQKSLLATLSPGKRTRLRRLLFEFGPGHGTLLFLPIDQGIEHGPRDFFPNPASKDPEYQFHLAAEAGYSAIACQIGLATKYYPDYAGQVPLILKVNGKTDIPPSDDALSTTNASVEDAVRLGADAVGYTLYVGSPRQDADLHQLQGVREDCDRFGMPLIIWAYPRGAAIDKKGGQNVLLRDRLRRPPGDGDGRRRRQAQHAEDRPGEGQGRPGPLQRAGGLPGGGRPPGRRARPGRSLVVLSGGSKIDDDAAARADPLHHGGRRLGRDLRPQRLAARALRGARDHRADQGDHALERHAHPVSAVRRGGATRRRRTPCIGVMTRSGRGICAAVAARARSRRGRWAWDGDAAGAGEATLRPAAR